MHRHLSAKNYFLGDFQRFVTNCHNTDLKNSLFYPAITSVKSFGFKYLFAISTTVSAVKLFK